MRFRYTVHRVDLQVRGLSPISLDVGFTVSMAVGTGLLGQRGFFEQFDIRYKLSKKYFELVPIAELNR